MRGESSDLAPAVEEAGRVAAPGAVRVYKQTKYTSNNALVQALNRVYLRNITDLVRRAQPRSLLDVGCGEGVVLRHLDHHVRAVSEIGLDIDGTGLRVAQSQNRVSLLQGSIYSLPFASASVDLVLCCEVLEHVEAPVAAIAELARVSAQWVLLSVPNEPIWRLSNMARGKYLRDFGNTMGHIQHWTRWGFLRLVEKHLDVTCVKTWLPFWSMLLARRPTRAGATPGASGGRSRPRQAVRRRSDGGERATASAPTGGPR